MLNNEFPPLGGGTGTVNQVLLERFMPVENLEIDLITSALGNQLEESHLSDRIRLFKVPVNNRDIHHASNRELVAYSVRAFPVAMTLHRARKYDLCFAWSAVPAGGVAWILHLLTRLPYLIRVCGPDIPGFEQRYDRLYPVLKPAIRSIWRDAAAVVAKCSSEVALIQAVDSKVDVTILPNGVDLDRFQSGKPIPDDGPFHVLCVGRLIERKSQDHLIKSVKQLADRGIDVILHLVGTGDSRPTYEALVRSLELTDQVIFHGYVPREHIPAYYATAHAFALPSYNEGMSVATLEAMASGLPLVVTRTGGTADLVTEGVNGFTFEWSDIDTLTNHLCQLSTKRRLCRTMGQASRSLAQRFTWDHTVAGYLHVFSDLAAQEIKENAGKPVSTNA
jgi:glycosyltransferase involved in cell wall biosynthesis